MNHCHICDWDAPTAAALRDHVLTCHAGKKNEPVTRGYSMGILDEATPVIDWEKTGADWQAIADRVRSNLYDNAFVAHYTKGKP